jgi:hypothetical protein
MRKLITPLLALMLGLTASPLLAGSLRDLEMDVLGPGELPGASIPRIELPRDARGGERVEGLPGVTQGRLSTHGGFGGMDTTEQARESDAISRDTLETLRDQHGLVGAPTEPSP